MKNILLTFLLIFSLSAFSKAQVVNLQKLPEHSTSVTNIPEAYSKAMAAFNSGDYVKAYRLFEGFYAERGVDEELSSSAKYYMAESLLRLDQVDAAIAAFGYFTAKYTESNFRADGLYKLGTLYYRKQEYAKARETLRLLIEDYPYNDFVGSAMYLIGDSYSHEGRFDEAIEFLNDAIKARNNISYKPNSIYLLANIYEKKGDYRQAVANYDTLLAYYKTNSLAPHAQIRIGLCYFELKEYDNAILELNDPLIKELPDSLQTEAEYILANSYYRLREYKDAQETYKAILNDSPNSPVIRNVKYGLAWVYFQQAKYEDAYKLFSSLTRKGASDSVAVKSLFWSAESRRYAGKDDRAIELYEEFLDQYPESPLVLQVRYLIGVVKYKTNKESASEEYLKDAAKSSDEAVQGRALAVLGEIRLRANDFPAAKNYFTEALNLSGLAPELKNRCLLGLGIADYYLNHFDEALSSLNKLAGEAPSFESSKTHFYLAESYFAKKDFKRALKEYNAVGDKEKELIPQVLYGKAYTYFNLKEFPNSSFNFSEFLRRYKNNPHATDAKLRLADSYYGEKKFSEASRIYKEVFLADNSINNDYAYYQYAQALYKAGNTSEAIREFSNLQEKFPDSKYVAESQYIIGWIFFQKGNYRQAVASYHTLLSHYPSSSVVPITYNAIGNSYFNMGNYDSAIVYYKKVVTGYPASNYAFDAIVGIKDAYMADDRPDEAVSYIDEYVGQNPQASNIDQILFRKGEMYFNLRNYEMAKKSYKDFVTRFPQSSLIPDAYFAIGKSAEILKQNEEALYNFNIVFKNYLMTDPGTASVLEMGKIHSDLKNYDAAISIYSTAIDKFPPESQKIPEIMFNRAMAYISKGDLPKAYDDFNYLIQYYTSTVFADNAKFEISLIELARKNYETSDMLLKELSEARTDELGAKAQYYYGVSLLQQNKIDDAISALVRVKFAFPGFDEWLTSSYLKLGECYEKKNDNAKAREMYLLVVNHHRNDKFGAEAQNKLRTLD
ncbi:MAG: tetratricopeptide repeat protein [Ignavibacteria bacterium]|jgi:tetratricopeptide (TPR) repeat protein|nr:tetratricopeptide repeat protein [Ignavibacteria bacterium]MCU7503961.1 tetratricopeptide repeat protein [Ignavibacteria bacterium]MCU7515818.1 tetratricopeptide repeat protein [Ignavibacteria bacterium]